MQADVSVRRCISWRNVRAQMIVRPTITVTKLVQLFMHDRHFIGQSVLVSAILDSKVYRSSAYQPTRNCSPKRLARYCDWWWRRLLSVDHTLIEDQNHLGIPFRLCSNGWVPFSAPVPSLGSFQQPIVLTRVVQKVYVHKNYKYRIKDTKILFVILHSDANGLKVL